jgi:hypothetical protein
LFFWIDIDLNCSSTFFLVQVILSQWMNRRYQGDLMRLTNTIKLALDRIEAENPSPSASQSENSSRFRTPAPKRGDHSSDESDSNVSDGELKFLQRTKGRQRRMMIRDRGQATPSPALSADERINAMPVVQVESDLPVEKDRESEREFRDDINSGAEDGSLSVPPSQSAHESDEMSDDGNDRVEESRIADSAELQRFEILFILVLDNLDTLHWQCSDIFHFLFFRARIEAEKAVERVESELKTQRTKTAQPSLDAILSIDSLISSHWSAISHPYLHLGVPADIFDILNHLSTFICIIRNFSLSRNQRKLIGEHQRTMSIVCDCLCACTRALQYHLRIHERTEIKAVHPWLELHGDCIDIVEIVAEFLELSRLRGGLPSVAKDDAGLAKSLRQSLEEFERINDDRGMCACLFALTSLCAQDDSVKHVADAFLRASESVWPDSEANGRKSDGDSMAMIGRLLSHTSIVVVDKAVNFLAVTSDLSKDMAEIFASMHLVVQNLIVIITTVSSSASQVRLETPSTAFNCGFFLLRLLSCQCEFPSIVFPSLILIF